MLSRRNGADEAASASRREALYAAARAKADASRPKFWATLKGDIRRHGGRFFQRSVIGLTVYRIGVWARTQPGYIRVPVFKIYGIVDKLVRPITGIHMYCTVLAGDDLHLIHAEAPISIHPDAVIGDRVGIMHNVTIGETVELEGVPIIGNDVFIGVGAVILGPVIVGDGARVAANSLVITDIPPNSTAIGVPARAFPRLAPQGSKSKTEGEANAGSSPSKDDPLPAEAAGRAKIT
jgi:serine O-acetyltransferase